MNGIKSQISVIVPVYNVEQFLPKCLDSIIGQTYPNLQIILVDDGSTDGCGEICDEYARKDNRIKVIHQENSGTVKARNSGISLATGDYLAFVDADDYLPFDAYQELSAAIESENYDIVWYDVNIIGYDVYCISPNACKDSKNMLAAFLKNRKCSISGSQCSKIIKKKFYDSVDIWQDENCSVCEDQLLTVELLCSNPKIGYINRSLYYYNHSNESSLTASGRNIMLAGAANIIHIGEYLVAKGLMDIYKDDYAYWVMCVKIALLHDGQLIRARTIFPYAHERLAFYRMAQPISWIYWLGFNGGWLGKHLIACYIKLISLKKQYSK